MENESDVSLLYGSVYIEPRFRATINSDLWRIMQDVARAAEHDPRWLQRPHLRSVPSALVRAFKCICDCSIRAVSEKQCRIAFVRALALILLDSIGAARANLAKPLVDAYCQIVYTFAEAVFIDHYHHETIRVGAIAQNFGVLDVKPKVRNEFDCAIAPSLETIHWGAIGNRTENETTWRTAMEKCGINGIMCLIHDDSTPNVIPPLIISNYT